jgi:hypothetical protein
MANAGVALADGRYVNSSNAASLTVLNEHLYTFEISTRLRQVSYSGANVKAPNNQTFDFGVRKVGIGTRISKKWGSAVGLQPFSSVNYSFIAEKNIQGTSLSNLTMYDGEGGVNQFYWANGYKLTKNTSLGVTASFLFGSLRQTETIYGGFGLTPSLVTTKNTYLRNYYLNFSIQTGMRISSKWESRFGLTFSPQTDLFAEYTTRVTDEGNVLLKNDAAKNDYYTLPVNITAGAALIKNNSRTFSVSGSYQGWKSLGYRGTNYQLINSSRIMLGYQNSKRVRNFFNREYEKKFFQLGFFAGQSYLKIKNVPLTEFGASIGIGGNSKNGPMGSIIVLEAGRRGASNSDILSENYINLGFTFSYSDFFLSRKRYN